jgi:hypothetical protein
MNAMQLLSGSVELLADFAIRQGEVRGALHFSGVLGRQIVQPFGQGANVRVRLLAHGGLLAQRGQVRIFHEHVVTQEPSLSLAAHQLIVHPCELFFGLLTLALGTPVILAHGRRRLSRPPMPFARLLEGLAKPIVFAPVPVHLTLKGYRPFLEPSAIAFGSMEMLRECAYQGRHSLDRRADLGRCHCYDELVSIRIRPRRRKVDSLPWERGEIQWNLGFLHRTNNAGLIDHVHTGTPDQLMKGGAVEEVKMRSV